MKSRFLILVCSILAAACTSTTSSNLPLVTPSPTAQASATVASDLARVPLVSTPAPTQAPGVPTPAPSSTPAPALTPAPAFLSNPTYLQAMAARRNGDYAGAQELFRTLGAGTGDPDLVREGLFRRGEVLYLANDSAAAFTLLSQFLASFPSDSRAPRAQYLLAQIESSQRKYTDAIEHMKSFRTQTASLVGEADLQIGDWMAALGDSRGALRQYLLAVTDKGMPSSRRVEVLKRAAELHLQLGEPGLAALQFSTALDIAPTDTLRADLQYRWGLALAKTREQDLAVSHWQTAVNAYPQESGAYNSLLELVNRGVVVPDYTRGLVNYYNGAYEPAIAAFGRVLAAEDNPEARYFLALADEKYGLSAEALAQYARLAAGPAGQPHVADAVYREARLLGLLGRTDSAVSTYRQFASLFPADPRADDALEAAAFLLDRQNRNLEAAALFTQVQSDFPAGNRASASLYSAGLELYMAKDFTNAAARWETLAGAYPSSPDTRNGLYWLGKLAQQRGDQAAALRAWQGASIPPRAFYSWRAMDQLKSGPSSKSATFALDESATLRSQTELWLSTWRPAVSSASVSLDGSDVENDPGLRRAAELFSVDETVLAGREIQGLIDRFRDDPHALLALSLFLQHIDQPYLSLQAARRLFELSPAQNLEEAPRLLQQLLYPVAFSDLVLAESAKTGLDPALLFAVIRQESAFNPSAASSAAALGLAQVVPSTGAGIAAQLGIRGFAVQDLFRPVVSVRFGAYYLSQMLAEFNGNVLYALMAYNGGPGNTLKWVRSDVDMAIENITLRESYTYVRTVYSQYRSYQVIYGK